MNATPSTILDATGRPYAPTLRQARDGFGGPTQIAHGAEGDLSFAVIPLPAYPTPRNSLIKRSGAIAASYSGRFEEMVDLGRQTIFEDGFFDGILRTMADGILGLPVNFSQGTPEMRSALLNADGTPGDFGAMHPHEECAQIFKDGLVYTVGLGQYLLMCWQCGYTENDLVECVDPDAPPDVKPQTFEVCKRCCARRVDRPIGQRQLFQLQHRDPRWLYQNPITFQWFYTGRQGLIPIIDGGGEWFMFRTGPALESWRYGIWIAASLYAIFSRDAQYDAQNTSAVCAPTPVLRAVKPVPETTRAAAEQRIRSLGFDNRMVLNGEWIYEIVAAKAEYKDICTDIVTRASDAFETLLTGNVMGRAARAAFTDAGIYKRTTSERREFYAGAWYRQIAFKGLVHWVRDNYGTGQPTPVASCDVRSPEDKLADSKALGEEGDALGKIKAGADAVGVELEPAWILERLQAKGIRARAKVGPPQITHLDLGVDGKNAVLRGNVALASMGLAPFDPSDPRGDMTLAALLNIAKGGASGAPGPSANDAPPAALPAAVPASPSPLDARVAAPGDEPAADPGADHAARFAAEMTAAGAAKCPHERVNLCERCGIQRTYSAVAGKPGEPPTFPIAWRPIVATSPAIAQVAPCTRSPPSRRSSPASPRFSCPAGR